MYESLGFANPKLVIERIIQSALLFERMNSGTSDPSSVRRVMCKLNDAKNELFAICDQQEPPFKSGDMVCVSENVLKQWKGEGTVLLQGDGGDSGTAIFHLPKCGYFTVDEVFYAQWRSRYWWVTLKEAHMTEAHPAHRPTRFPANCFVRFAP